MPRFKNDKLTINLSNKLKAELEKICEEKQMSMSEFIRYLIMNYLENKKNNEK